MTGQQASTGKQIDAAVKLYMAQNGNTVAGKKIEVILKDDTGVPDVTKRLAQELVVNDKVAVLAGFGLTPSALATAPIATQAKMPEVVMAAATSIDHRGLALHRAHLFTLPQSSVPMADWALKNGIKKVVTLVSDYGPGIDAEKSFTEQLQGRRRQVIENAARAAAQPRLRAVPAEGGATPSPTRCSSSCPRARARTFMKQFVERGLDKAGIKLIGTGDVTDDDQLNDMGDAALGVVTSHHYSAAHDRPANKAFVEAFKKANNGLRPNFMAVGGYDGMRLIYEALKKTKGEAGGDALLAAMKGMIWESPRGPVSIDPETRDIVQNIYIRKVEKKDGELYNVEFATIPDVKDPVRRRRGRRWRPSVASARDASERSAC